LAFAPPVDDALGIKQISREDGTVVNILQPRPNDLNARGEIAPGVLCVLADGLLGNACASVIPSDKRIVTSSLHLHLVSRPTIIDGPITGTARTAGIVDNGILSRADLKDVRGRLVAAASARFAVLGADSRAADRVRSANVSRHEEPTFVTAGTPFTHTTGEAGVGVTAPVRDWLGLRLVEASSPTQIRVAMEARAEFRNERGGVHGGISALLGEQAAELVLDLNPSASSLLKPVELRVTFFRPVEANHGSVECRADVVHLGSTLAATRARLFAPTGKIAVAIDVVFAAA
jgi:uncharacterized protein (TIGR00369 family)